jgi:hypothetical protein
MNTNRSEVYHAIDTERDYQESLARHTVKDQSPMEHLAIIEVIAARMKQDFYYEAGQPAGDYMRKIAAVAVYCMEQHGAINRSN